MKKQLLPHQVVLRWIGSVFLLGFTFASQGEDAIPAMGNREGALVAATPGYAFHSDFWLNLHQYLYGIAGGGPEQDTGFGEERLDCFLALDAGKRRTWENTVSFYKEHLGHRVNRSDPLMERVRYRLNNLENQHISDPQLVDTFLFMEKAAPAYRACLWDLHDARNRSLIGEMVSMLALYGRPLQEQLSDYYRTKWPVQLPVDIVSYVSFAAANTTGRPGLNAHVLLASAQKDTRSFLGLEVVLHEGSHLMFGARHGEVTRALSSAAEDLGVELPRGLWHAISFHTSGTVVQDMAASQGVDYEPYWLRYGVFIQFQDAVHLHWQPYLEGKRGLEATALDLVRATARP